jgi:choline dehydrogenase-like flavoprotein
LYAHVPDDGIVLETDVCVVGGGPAGLTLALELGRAGRRTILLESGGTNSIASAQILNRGQVSGSYPDLQRTRHRQLGGTVHLWNTSIERRSRWAKYVPLDPRDLCAQGHEWPFRYDHLEPFYRRAQASCDLGPFAWDADCWARTGHEPPWPGNGLSAKVYQMSSGNRWIHDTPREIYALGYVTVLTESTVTRLVVDPGGTRIGSVVFMNKTVQTKVRANHVVLATGAIENARLLLASRMTDQHRPPGTGFMEHPRDFAMVLIPRNADSYRQLHFYDARRAADGTVVCGRIAPTRDLLDAERLPSFSVTLLPWRGGNICQWLGNRLLRRPVRQPGYGWSEHDPKRAGWQGFRLVLNLEQHPDSANRVTLGSEQDRFGVPLPLLHWSWTASEQANLERIRIFLRDQFETAGLGRLEWPAGALPDPNAHHHAGTTAMHDDPLLGVVDADCRVHGLENLWVCGASVFPTAGFANPTLTIVAMAIRLADRLLEER